MANEAQTLMVLGETQVARRLAEDQLDAAMEDVRQLTMQRQELESQVESLRSEKAILMLDVSDLQKQIDEAKGGDKAS